MPDLPERMDREARMTANVSSILAPFITTAPSGAMSFDRLAADVESVARGELRDTFVAAALLLFWTLDIQFDRYALDTAATQWASERAAALGGEVANNSRSAMAAGWDGAELFSRDRAARLAATETTRAISAGEGWARGIAETASGIPLLATWHTEDDASVCPVCSRLNDRDEVFWGDQFPSGPPAHPNCRCWLSYAPLGSRQLAGASA